MASSPVEDMLPKGLATSSLKVSKSNPSLMLSDMTRTVKVVPPTLNLVDDSVNGKVYLGDSLDLLISLPKVSVDFCYIDPPFMSQTERVGPGGSYGDKWSQGLETYLSYMRDRLMVLQGVMKPTGTVMVHVDSRVSHYLKIMLDQIFGYDQFINEIVWCYNSGGAGKRNLAKKHDTILFYAVTPDYHFNVVREPYPHDYGDKPGFHPDGRMLNDWWTIGFLSTRSKERCGYPTQKPLPLLERIMDVACSPGDTVLDFFCGSGTTGVAAVGKGCKYILCDENVEAVDHTLARVSGLT